MARRSTTALALTLSTTALAGMVYVETVFAHPTALDLPDAPETDPLRSPPPVRVPEMVRTQSVVDAQPALADLVAPAPRRPRKVARGY